MLTLAERMKLALAGPPKISQASLARYCGVKPPSVSAWVSGETQSLEGTNLLKAAECLKVNPKWLGEGIGPMRGEHQASIDPAPPAAPPGPAPDVHIALEAIARRLMTADAGTRELVAGMLSSMAKNPESYSRVATGLQAILSSGHSDEHVEAMMPATRALKQRAKADYEGS